MNNKLRRTLFILPLAIILVLFVITLARDSQISVVRSKYCSHIFEAEGNGVVIVDGMVVDSFSGTLPTVINVPRTSCVTLSMNLKSYYDLRDYDAYLSFQSSKAEIEVFYNDELIFSRKYNDNSKPYFHSYEGVAQNLVKLPTDYNNGNVKIVFSYPDKTVTEVRVRPFYVGNESAVRIRAIFLGAMPMIFGWILILLSVFILIIGLMNRKSKNYTLFSIFGFLVVVGIWLASQSLSRFIISDNSAIHSQFSYLALYLLPLSVAFIVSAYYMEKSNRFMRIMKRVALAFSETYAFMELLDLLSPFQMQYTLTVAGAFALFYTIVMISYLIVLKTVRKRKRLTSIILTLSFTSAAIFFDEVLLLSNVKLNSTAAFILLYMPYIVAAFILVRDITGFYIKEQRNCYAKEVLFNLYSTDTLSGAYTREYFDQHASEHTLQLSHTALVIYMDIDSMKRINDIHGHLAGDEAIRNLGRTVDTLFFGSREKPLFVRIGGDEFLLIINQDHRDRARAEELIVRLEDTYELIAEGKTTISAGYAHTGIRVNLKQAIEKADAMLIEKKKNKTRLG
jgi:diguanylate cyclase (GGDEF) domain